MLFITYIQLLRFVLSFGVQKNRFQAARAWIKWMAQFSRFFVLDKGFFVPYNVWISYIMFYKYNYNLFWEFVKS